MEDLTKHQLILLTLLISFVTSIATGIITFSLLQKAPVEVTQTINRVVERTIEKVVPAEGGNEIIREVQVVNEEDLILKSIEKNINSIVRIKSVGFDGSEIFSGFGLVLKDKIIVTNSPDVNSSSVYKVLFADGKSYSTAKSWSDGEFVFFNISLPSSENYVFSPTVLGDADSLKLGQTAIAISGKKDNAVSIGRISQKEISDKNTSLIITDIPKERSQHGSPLLNLAGEIVGLEISTGEERMDLSYIPINKIKNLIAKALEELSK